MSIRFMSTKWCKGGAGAGWLDVRPACEKVGMWFQGDVIQLSSNMGQHGANLCMGSSHLGNQKPKWLQIHQKHVFPKNRPRAIFIVLGW
jgi:hypothetical protein